MILFFFFIAICCLLQKSYHNDYLNGTLAIECIEQEEINLNYKKRYIYAHRKFSKVVNFFYHYDIIDLPEENEYELKITFLMCDYDDQEVKLLSKKHILENEHQWHLSINHEDNFTIHYKKKILEDGLIFGKKNLRYGQLYTTSQIIPKNSICNNTIPIALIQLDRKINFQISLNE